MQYIRCLALYAYTGRHLLRSYMRRDTGMRHSTSATAIPGTFQRTFRAPARPAASLSSARSHGPSTRARREKLLLRKTRARCVFSLFPCTCRQAVRPPYRKAANLSKLVQAIRLQFGSQQFLKHFEKNKNRPEELTSGLRKCLVAGAGFEPTTSGL